MRTVLFDLVLLPVMLLAAGLAIPGTILILLLLRGPWLEEEAAREAELEGGTGP